MRRATHLLVLAAFIFSCGGHWYILQGLAWVNMIREYSQVVPLAEAVGMTFSGKYPCSLCKAIAEKKAAEDAKVFVFDKYDKKFFSPVCVVAATPSAAPLLYANFSARLLTRTESPPTPPPRSLLS